MSDTTPIARSQITIPGGTTTVRDGWEGQLSTASGALTLGDASRVTKLHVRARQDGAVAAALGGHGTASRRDGVLVIGSGPGEWLLLSDRKSIAELEAMVPDDGEYWVSRVDLTHGRALMRLTGADARSLLAKCCSINFRDDVTPNGSALRTSVAVIATDIVRDDRDGVTSYLLHCERSSAQYLFDSLLGCGREFGIVAVDLWQKEL